MYVVEDLEGLGESMRCCVEKEACSCEGEGGEDGEEGCECWDPGREGEEDAGCSCPGETLIQRWSVMKLGEAFGMNVCPEDYREYRGLGRECYHDYIVCLYLTYQHEHGVDGGR